MFCPLFHNEKLRCNFLDLWKKKDALLAILLKIIRKALLNAEGLLNVEESSDTLDRKKNWKGHLPNPLNEQ